MQKLNLTVALGAGLLGGFISHNFTLPAAHAQNPPAPNGQPAVAQEIRAQRFTVVDANNRPIGTFMVEPDSLSPMNRDGSRGRVVLRDPSGREMWSAGGSSIRPLIGGTR